VIDYFATPAESNNCKLTIFAPPARIGQTAYMTAAELNTLQAAGHEIAAHSYSHIDLSGLSETEIHYEMRRAIEALEELITDKSYRCKTMAYPFHNHTATCITAAQQWYIAARNGYASGDGDPDHAPTGSNKLYAHRLYQSPCYVDFSTWTGRTAITGITGSGATVTVTAPGHPFVNGDSVVISGTSAYNGTFADITKTGANTFTYADDATGAETPAAAYADHIEAVIRANVNASLLSCRNSNYPVMVIGHTLEQLTGDQMGYICEEIDADELVQSMTFGEFAEWLRVRTAPGADGDEWTSPYNAWLGWRSEDESKLTVTIAEAGGITGGDCLQLVNGSGDDVKYYFKLDRKGYMSYTVSAFVKSDTGAQITNAVALRAAGESDGTPDNAETTWSRIQFSSTPTTDSAASEFGVVVKAGKSCYLDLFQCELGVTAAGAYEDPYPLAE
jgi:hypothetical protein